MGLPSRLTATLPLILTLTLTLNPSFNPIPTHIQSVKQIPTLIQTFDHPSTYADTYQGDEPLVLHLLPSPVLSPPLIHYTQP